MASERHLACSGAGHDGMGVGCRAAVDRRHGRDRDRWYAAAAGQLSLAELGGSVWACHGRVVVRGVVSRMLYRNELGRRRLHVVVQAHGQRSRDLRIRRRRRLRGRLWNARPDALNSWERQSTTQLRRRRRRHGVRVRSLGQYLIPGGRKSVHGLIKLWSRFGHIIYSRVNVLREWPRANAFTGGDGRPLSVDS